MKKIMLMGSTSTSVISCQELSDQSIAQNKDLTVDIWFIEPAPKSPDTGTKTCLYLLGSSYGLVLFTTSLFNQMIYYVCNPLTKKWVSLPPPPKVSEYVMAGFECDGSSSSLISTSYKVVRIPKFETRRNFEVEIFTSDSGDIGRHYYTLLHVDGVISLNLTQCIFLISYPDSQCKSTRKLVDASESYEGESKTVVSLTGCYLRYCITTLPSAGF
ncbi:hypothetical protein C5167_050828 [Papaver somniferum]|uniref:F-box protein At3g26010-like beta-propeller domain-containing protein n=1 Tax=Papaver somniferum TaxID=3469 RepID=A0A4Y7KSI2_PAPSO|nr:hypothetical protein C5167_050828 [Papaver somniferum]